MKKENLVIISLAGLAIIALSMLGASQTNSLDSVIGRVTQAVSFPADIPLSTTITLGITATIMSAITLTLLGTNKNVIVKKSSRKVKKRRKKR